MTATLATIVPDRAADRPDAVAVRSADRALTYAELDRRCRRLGARLADAGVGPGDRVGIWLHKSVDSMTTVHAVLRVGAAYVPLDPAADPAYVADLLADAGARVVVADTRPPRQAQLAGARPEVVLVHPGVVDDDPDVDLAPAPVGADAMAYLMYTSGSTGRPKGILHTHRSGMAYAARAAALYELAPDDILANIAPLHFDQSTFELFSGPIAGATTLVVPEPYLRLPASLSALVQDERATVWYSVPSVLRLLLERGALEDRDLSSLRWVLFGGEVFPPEALTRLMAHLPGARFSNVYGPAEVNQCMYHHLDGPPGREPVPIGRAWEGTELAVVDGELLVRTDTVMDGYWNRPDLTEAAFVAGPDGAGGWYATGDLVSAADDGTLVFVGRVDNQVKVRGQRVELEAVDVALSSLDGVAQAVAVVLDGPDGLPVVAGLVTLAPGVSGIPDDASTSLGRQLPAHALPQSVVVVDALPRTPNGKVDRRAASALILEPQR